MFRLQQAVHLVPVDAHFVVSGRSDQHVLAEQMGDHPAGRHVVDVERVGHLVAAWQPDGSSLREVGFSELIQQQQHAAPGA